MSTEPNAAELRRRVAELRRLADHLDATPFEPIVGRAGPDTWVGPRAAALHAQLAIDRQRLAAAVDDLRRHARALERQAEAIDLASAASLAR